MELLKTFEHVLLVYHITVNSYIHRCDPEDCRYFAYFLLRGINVF
jgi:hypothetical protein